MSFADLQPKEPPRRFFQTDWSKEEKRFKENHSKFLASIKSVNPQISFDNYDTEIKPENSEPTQTQSSSGFSLFIEEKKETEERDTSKEFVEYKRAEKPNEGNSAPQTKSEERMDFLDEFLGDAKTQVETPKSTETPPSPEQPIAVSGVVAETPPPEEKKTDPLFAPEDKKETLPEEKKLSSDEFNYEKFAVVRGLVQQIMTGKVDEEQVIQYIDTVVSYCTNLELDEHRVRPEILADTMVKVQAKKDRVQAIVLDLTKKIRYMREAEEFLKTSGVSCSKASSETKRMGDVRLVIPEFFMLLATVEAAYELYEKQYKHLCNQTDVISRLVSTQQNEMRYKDIFTGRVEGQRVPFDPPYRKMTSETPVVPNNTPVAAPVIPERNTDGLDSFVKPAPKKGSTPVNGTVDFEF